jgi:RHS repeat-associated protein
LKDENYRTEGDEQKDKIVNEHAYQYDANGNLVYVNTAKEKQDGTNNSGSNEKKYLWDEENRLQAVNINGFISSYWYDASGERVIKASGDDEGMFVNGLFSGARTSTDNFTAYINPYLVVSKGGNYTKHIYMGSQRIVSKLGDLDSYGQDPRRIAYAGSDVDGATVDFAGKYTQSQQTIKDRYADFEVPYNGKDNDDYVNGGGFCCDDNPNLRAGAIGAGNDNPELYQYYYHSDHLGSTSLITNLDGELVQHVEYVPFGEVFIEERNNRWNTPYLFNAKELDEETGLYYYGARYFDARISLWLSVDPLTEQKLNISGYAYCLGNPIKYLDPDGRDEEQRETAVQQAEKYVTEKKEGNQYKMGAKGEPGEKVDCSGLVSNAVVAGGENNPNHGNKSSGVLNIESNLQQLSDKDVTSGNVVTFKFDKGYPYHTGIVTDVVQDENETITSFTMIHSSSGKGPNQQTVTIDEGKLGKAEIKFYKWDTKPDKPKNANTPALQTNSTQPQTPNQSHSSESNGFKAKWNMFVNSIYSAMDRIKYLPFSGY